MARLLDVARAAGVSRSTVSNVFSRPERVRPEIRERVEEAARALGYAGPDPMGRALRGGKVNAVGIVPGGSLTTVFEHAYFHDFMHGAAEVCDRHHAALVMVSGVDEAAATRGVKTALVDGFILHNPKEVQTLVALAERRGLPFIAVDMDAPPRVSSIRLDNRDGARQAIRHLLGLGHRRFAVFSFLLPDRGYVGPIYHAPGDPGRRLVETFHDTRERLAGYAEALAEAGLSIGDVPIVEAFSDESRVGAGARMLLDNLGDATAVVAMADDLAISVLKEARRRGIVTPAELSVVGFDDIAAASSAVPPLTTIAQPIRAKGSAAAEFILAPPAEPVHVVLPVKLVVRGSTGPPRGAPPKPAH
ncbi:MAG: LacI family DNA-binding transcriptional regulator [Bauldia sp.]